MNRFVQELELEGGQVLRATLTLNVAYIHHGPERGAHWHTQKPGLSRKNVIEWNKIVMAMSGIGALRRNVLDAILIARVSTHPDAMWLAPFFNSYTPSDMQLCTHWVHYEDCDDHCNIIRNALYVPYQEGDPRALYFCFMEWREQRIRSLELEDLEYAAGAECQEGGDIYRSAMAGFAPAQTYMRKWGRDWIERVRWLQLAVDQGDAHALYTAAKHMGTFASCNVDEKDECPNCSAVNTLMDLAAQYGSISAAQWILCNIHARPYDRIRWGIVFSQNAFINLFKQSSTITKTIAGICSDTDLREDRGNARVIAYHIGRFCYDCRESRYMIMLRETPNSKVRLTDFISWEIAARETCVAWVLCAKRMGFYKDIRGMIAKTLWEERELSLGVPLRLASIRRSERLAKKIKTSK